MKYLFNTLLATLVLVTSCTTEQKNSTQKHTKMTQIAHTTNTQNVNYKTIKINNINIAYREAGNPENPTIVLLHGFPASSHQYRKVLHTLSDEFHLIAPDYPGFGNSDFPSRDEFTYTFDNIAATIDTFLEEKNINSYAIMMQDYGAPVGFRIATAHPERVTAIITQNGNAYEEGLAKGWEKIDHLWANRNEETEKALHPVFSLEGLEWQYTHGTRNPELVNPDNWHLDYYRMQRPNALKMNLDLFYDYQNNIKLYPTWQQYIREQQPPILVVWGKNDAFFNENGAEAFKKDAKNIEYHVYDTGHFALEEDGIDIMQKMRAFMKKLNK
ncbi:alpha/beta hydrolase [uncultured Kordia sp.]|uniref:alpha/beta fold hydrolase n=1 Tax=uncultured Kordia sp. TaxID=507699 RepID=UPI00262E63C7|nr:alpha/beta hydrolase [uncultured Kordia sp.]